MRCLAKRGARCLFYVIVGVSMVVVITPSPANAFTGSQAFHLWPLIGLLAYLLHLFEDTGKPASIVRTADRRRFTGARSSALFGASRSAAAE